MHALTAIVTALVTATAAVTPTPTPTSTSVDPTLVTPGPWGFAAIAFIAIAVIVLLWDMLRRIRRARYREEVGRALDAEQAAAAQRGSTDASQGTRPDGTASP
ncbi:MAG: hypothetical protein QM602_11600 [Microbacterium sp.]